MLYEIKNRWTAELIFSIECGSMKHCVEAAVGQGISLLAANLQAANLRAANLRDADLRDANLQAANLRDANLQSANLRDANLQAANLQAANLRAANLRAANLQAADLRDANLRDADLRDANLTSIRDDIWAVLSASPAEVHALRESLIAGKIDGLQYEGECACLVGTLAMARHCNFEAIPGLKPDSSRASEIWFSNIRKGDSPETNQFAKLALEWIDAWLANMAAAFGAPVAV